MSACLSRPAALRSFEFHLTLTEGKGIQSTGNWS